MSILSSGVSRTTSDSYENRFNGLVKRFSVETGLSMPDDMYEFLKWADGLAFRLSSSTRRQYRSAIKYCLREYQIDFDLVNFNFLGNGLSRSKAKQYHGKRTSALKSKFIQPASLELLIAYLETSSSKSAWLVKDILIASSYFGLRPIEWLNADWTYEESSRGGLLVSNAKHSQGRAHGATRTIWLVSTEDGDVLVKLRPVLESADRLIKFFKALKESATNSFMPDSTLSSIENSENLVLLQRQRAEDCLLKARQYLGQLYRKNSALNKLSKTNRVTLYSARHQFAANAKKAGLAPEQVAALMGHASMDTNQESYGRRVNGVPGGFGVEADAHDVKEVLALSPEEKNSAFMR